MMGSKAFESPLISHARMRAMYRALVETRILSENTSRKLALPKKLEACWVGTTIDLRPGDLVSDAAGGAGWAASYIGAVGLREAARAANALDVRRAYKSIDLQSDKSFSFAGSEADRLLCVAGQAMALKSAGAGGVAVAFVEASALKPAEWRRVLAIANQGELPLVFVVLPGKKMKIDLQALANRVGNPTIPVIPVDAGDAVALYRVAQETYVRARADGGVVVIECVAMHTDPIAHLAAQLGRKGICTERWIARVAPSFQALASKR